MRVVAVLFDTTGAAEIFRKMTIVHDKGKPAVRQGRKAVSLYRCSGSAFRPETAEEIVRLPKAIGESRSFILPAGAFDAAREWLGASSEHPKSVRSPVQPSEATA